MDKEPFIYTNLRSPRDVTTSGHNNYRVSEEVQITPLAGYMLREVESGDYLTGDHMNKFNEILSYHTNFHPQNVFFIGALEFVEPVHSPHIQLLACKSTTNIHEITHWICTYYDGQVINVYDSMYSGKFTEHQLAFIERMLPHQPPTIFHKEVHQQSNSVDCGVFAIAYAVSIANGKDPRLERYNETEMRYHLLNVVFNQNRITPFPEIELTTPRESYVTKKGRPKKKAQGRPKTSNLSVVDQKRAARKKYDSLHPELRKAKVKNYQSSHPGEVATAKRKYQSSHPDKVATANRKYQSSHPEKIATAKRNYQSRHPDKVATANRKYQSSHPEVLKTKVKKYQSNNLQKFSAAVSKHQRANVQKQRDRQRDNYSTPAELKSLSRSTCLAMKSGNDLNDLLPLRLKVPSLLDTKSKTCSTCKAALFDEEKGRKEWCCGNGRYFLGFLPSLDAQFFQSEFFKKHARSYNNLFSFSALGVSHGFQKVSGRGGPELVKIQGRTYHRIFDINWSAGVNNVSLYIDDGSERKRLAESRQLDIHITNDIQEYLSRVNPLVESLRSLSNHANNNAHIVFELTNRKSHGPVLGDTPISGEIAGILNMDITCEPRKVAVWKTREGQPTFVSIFDPSYECLQYPLLFPHATAGWYPGLRDAYGSKLSQVKYYRRLLLSEQRFVQMGRLGQEYFVDMWSRTEEEKLGYIKHNQDKFTRVAQRQALDETIAGEGGSKAGKVYLPSSFTHSPRYMKVKYEDAMAIVSRLGKPSFFLTVTCNPRWPEIQASLSPHQQASERPDLCNRVFQLKLAQLLRLIKSGKLFGPMVSILYVIEFQKRGLPHSHLAIRIEGGGPMHAMEIDSFVRATIPLQDEANGRLRELVLQHMVHGPCGSDKLSAHCMDKETKRCTKGYPKPLSDRTYIDEKGYVQYRRPNEVALNSRSGKNVTNEWIVPYCPALLLLMECHCNLEIASSVRVIKYLYKYIHKGPDHAKIAIINNEKEKCDEIEQYVSLRYISASEAMWRIFEFNMCGRNPNVVALPVHLPDKDFVVYNVGEEKEALERTISKLNIYLTRPTLPELENLTYLDFFERYNVETKVRKSATVPVIEHQSGRYFFTKRVRGEIVTRMHWISPSMGELYYLRMLLAKIPAFGFSDIKSVDGKEFATFQEAAKARGLLNDENEYKEALSEASTFLLAKQLRQLYLCMILTGAPALILWMAFQQALSEDYLEKWPKRHERAFRAALGDIDMKLRCHGKELKDFGLPPTSENSTEVEREVVRYSTVACEYYVRMWLPQLTQNQRYVYDYIVEGFENDRTNKNIIFIDGPSGTGKTVLLRVITAELRRRNRIVLCTASTGIAALNHEGGVTAHAMFKLPLDTFDQNAYCDISVDSQRANLLRNAALIVWDEAPVAHRHNFECLDRTLRDITNIDDKPFGGKLILLAGDFRQIPPVIKHGTRKDISKASLKSTRFWAQVLTFPLHDPQRSRDDLEYSKFVLSVGEDEINKVKISDQFGSTEVIPLECVQPVKNLEDLIEFVFPENILSDPEVCCSRAILSGTNNNIIEINKKVLRKLKGKVIDLYSADTCVSDDNNLDEQQVNTDVFHALSEPGVPDHKVSLKVGAICILIRNLSFEDRLVNGTKIIIRSISKVIVTGEIPAAEGKEARLVSIPRIQFKFQAGRSGMYILRRQFPLKLAYALTINKSQGQTLDKVGLDLRDDVFAHGQLYVSLGRVRSRNNIRVLVLQNRRFGRDLIPHAVNVVHYELLNRC